MFKHIGTKIASVACAALTVVVAVCVSVPQQALAYSAPTKWDDLSKTGYRPTDGIASFTYAYNNLTIDNVSITSGSFTSIIDADGNETKEYCAYWLVETQAPSGYNLPASPVKVQFSAENSTEAVNWTVEGTVTNTNDFTLPLTGGPGQALLVFAGLAFTAAAAVLVTAASRRKKAVQK